MTQIPSLVRPRQHREDVAYSESASGIWLVDMAGIVSTTPSEFYRPAPGEDLLLREMNHRWSNDLQLVVGLLALQGRRAANPEVRQALSDATDRISILSRARSAMYRGQHHSLRTALCQVCEALQFQAELRSILIYLESGPELRGLSERQITILALAANELATNAIKHAFEDGKPGHIRVSTSTTVDYEVIVTVDDDGLPLAEAAARGRGVGMGLVKQLIASIGGILTPPPPGTKLFEMRVPVEVD